MSRDGGVSLNLMLAVQACADTASHVISDEEWPMAASLGELFGRLRDEGGISPAVAASLGKAVGLRNVVAHGYAGIDVARVHAAVTEGLKDLEAFSGEVSAWLSQRST